MLIVLIVIYLQDLDQYIGYAECPILLSLVIDSDSDLNIKFFNPTIIKDKKYCKQNDSLSHTQLYRSVEAL